MKGKTLDDYMFNSNREPLRDLLNHPNLDSHMDFDVRPNFNDELDY